MPTKPTHESAQHRVWKKDLKALEAMRRNAEREFAAARKPLEAAYLAALKKLTAFDKRAPGIHSRALTNIDRRIAIVKGRLGLPSDA